MDEDDINISETHRKMVCGSRSLTEDQLSDFASFSNKVVSVSLDPRRIVENFTDISNERANTVTQICKKSEHPQVC